MGLKELVYTGIPRGIEKTTALVVLLINVITPGLGTILSAFLGAQCENETVYVGLGQIITMPLLGLGFFWAMAWSVRLYKNSESSRTDEENPLVAQAEEEAVEE